MDSTLEEKYTVEVKNMFQLLANEIETAISQYDCFIKEHEEAVKEVLTPVPKRKKLKPFSDDPRVIRVRQERKDEYVKFTFDTTNDGSAYGKKKEQLDRTYNGVMAVDLAKKLCEIEMCDAIKKHTEGWNLINDTSGKISAQTNQVTSELQKNRKKPGSITSGTSQETHQ